MLDNVNKQLCSRITNIDFDYLKIVLENMIKQRCTD